MIKKIMAIMLASLLVALPASVMQLSASTPESKNSGLLKVIRVSADSNYEYGLKIGRLFGENYHVLSHIFWEKLEETRVLKSGITAEVNDLREIIAEYYPSHLERLKGLSDATLIPVDALIAIQLYLPGLFRLNINGCTRSASTFPATLNNETYLTYNVDGALDMWKIISVLFGGLVLIQDIPGLHKVISWGVPILFGMFFLNEKGLSCAWSSNTCTKDPGLGLPALLLAVMAMERCSNVHEAAELIEKMPRMGGIPIIGWDCMNLMWADAEGGIADFEFTHAHFAVKYGDETGGILAGANHNQYIDRNLTGCSPPGEYPSSYARCARMWELLRENYGSIDLEVLKSIVSDHGPGNPKVGDKNTICRHIVSPDNLKIPVSISDLPLGSTGICLITQPKDMIIHWCPGHPCCTPFIEIDCNKLFNS
jgi:hypothetical protein